MAQRVVRTRGLEKEGELKKEGMTLCVVVVCRKEKLRFKT